MPASPKLLLELTELCGESLTDRLSLNDEPAGLPSRPAHVREAQKVEHLRLTLASPLPVLGCVPPEFDQACLVRVQFQPELLQAVLPFLEKPLRVGTMF